MTPTLLDPLAPKPVAPPSIADAISSGLNTDGTVPRDVMDNLTGLPGEKLGIVKPTDDGALAEFGKGFKRGLMQYASSKANTFGMDDLKRELDFEMQTNQQLFPNSSKSHFSNFVNRTGGMFGAVGPDLAIASGITLLSGGLLAPEAAEGVGVSLAAAKAASALRAARIGKVAMGSLAFTSVYGDNADRLREELPDLPESERAGVNLLLSLTQGALMTLGPEGESVKQVAALTAIRSLARSGNQGLVKEAGRATMGVLKTAGRTFAKNLGTGVGVSVGSEAAHDLAVSVFDPSMTDEEFEAKLSKYPSLVLNSAIDMVGMALIPTTLNAIAEYQGRTWAKNIAVRNEKVREEVNTKPGQPYAVNSSEEVATHAVFVDLENSLKPIQKGTWEDRGQHEFSPNVELIENMAYHFAYADRATGVDPVARPEKYVKDLSLLIVNNPTHSAALIRLADNPQAQVDYINTHMTELKSKVSVLQDGMTFRNLEPSVEGQRQEIANSVPLLSDAQKAAISSDLSRGLSKVVLSEKDAPTPIPARLLVTSLGGKELAKTVYVEGELRNITLNEKKYVLKIDRDMSGMLIPEEQAPTPRKVLLEQETARLQKESGFAKTRGMTELAALKAENIENIEKLTRIDAFDKSWDGQVELATKENATQERADLYTRLSDAIEKRKVELDQATTKEAEAKMEFDKLKASLPTTVQPDKAQANVEALAAIEREKADAKARLDVAMKMRDEAGFEAPLFEQQQGKSGDAVGQFNRLKNLILFYAGHDETTLVHEWFHHLIENELMPSEMSKAIQDAYSIRQGDKDPEFTLASKENAADAFAQYVLENKLPDTARSAEAFNFLKGVLSTHWEEMKTWTQNGKEIFRTDEKLNVPEKVKAKFDEVLGNITPDMEMKIYGKALGDSVSVGGTSDRVEVSEKMIHNAAAKVAQRQGRTINQVVFEKLSKGAYGNKKSIDELDPAEMYRLQQEIEYDALRSEPPKENPPAVEEPKSEGPLFAEPYSRAEVDAFDPKILRGRVNKKFGDVDKAREAAVEMFGEDVVTTDEKGVHVLTNLTNRQLLQLLGDIGPSKKKAAEIQNVAADTKEVATSIAQQVASRVELPKSGKDTKTLIANIVNAAKAKTRYAVSGLFDAYSLQKFLEGSNPDAPLYKLLMTHFDDEQRTKPMLDKFFDGLYDFVKKNKIPYTTIEGWNTVDGSRMRNSDIIGMYLASDYGKNLERSDVNKMIQSWSGKLTIGHFKSAIEIVKKNPWMDKLAHYMSDDLTKIWEECRKTVLRNTGVDLGTVKGAYMTHSYEDGYIGRDTIFGLVGDMMDVPEGSQLRTVSGKRTESSGNEMRMDSFRSYLNHAGAMINYIAKADNVRRSLRILSDESVDNAFRQQFGDIEYLDALRRNIARELATTGKLRSDNTFENGMRRLNSNAARVYLPYAFGPMASQPISVLTGMAALPASAGPRFAVECAISIARVPKLLLKGFYGSGKNPIELMMDMPDVQFTMKHAPGILEPMKSRAEMEMRQSASIGGIDSIRFKGYQLSKLADTGMIPMAMLDASIRSTLFRTQFEITAEAMRKAGKTVAEAEKIAAFEGARVVRESSNPSMRLEKGLMQTESTELLKGAMLFIGQPTAQLKAMILNTAIPFWNAVKSGNIGEVTKVLPNTLYRLSFGAILPGIALGMLSRRRVQQNKEEFLKDAFIGGMLSTIPYVGSALWMSAVFGMGRDGFNLSSIWEDVVGKTMTAINNAVQGEFDFRDAKQLVQVGELLTKTPNAIPKFLMDVYEDVEINGKPFFSLKTLAPAAGVTRRED